MRDHCHTSIRRRSVFEHPGTPVASRGPWRERALAARVGVASLGSSSFVFRLIDTTTD